MAKHIPATLMLVLILSPSPLTACSVTVNPATGEITAVPQNATPFPQDGGGGAGMDGGGQQQPPAPIVSYRQIERGPDPGLRLMMFANTYDQMLRSLDPDLKKDGRELDPYERTFRFQGKLSEAAEVMHALDVAARVQTEGAEAPTDEEMRHAETVLAAAIKELADDVPDAVRAQVMHDPRKIWLLALGGMLAFVIGSAVLYRQKQRQVAAA